MINQRFDRLVVIKQVERPSHIKGAKTYWLCRCDCGKEKIVSRSNLVSHHIRSCGCLKKNLKPPVKIVHNMHESRIYRNWATMKQRCQNPNNPHFKNYGSRGIKVCQEWSDSFKSFYGYVSVLPNYNLPGYSLDRIDNNGNYEPGNVRWATRSEQARNQRPRKKTSPWFSFLHPHL